jgi:hypothetical protein
VITRAKETHDFLAELTHLIRAKYTFMNPSLYLHGSRSNGTDYADSDIDVTIVIADSSWQLPVHNDLRNLELDLPVALDATVHTIAELNAPVNGYDAGRLIQTGILIYGPDVRAQIYAGYTRPGHRQRSSEQVCKGTARLRGLDIPPTHLAFPDPAMPFLGYELVRKPSWYAPGVIYGTKELVATATWCASAWLSLHMDIRPYSKHEAVQMYEHERGGEDGALMGRLWKLCREHLTYHLPTQETDCTELRDLCSRFLGLEREVTSLIRDSAES